MVRQTAVAVLCAALALSALAQTTPTPYITAPAPLVEKIDVRVVNVDVTVTDRGGKPITGLTRDDFEVLEDGVRQPITNFHVVQNAVARPGDTPSAKADSEPPPQAERFRRKVLVLVDNMNTPVHARQEALRKLEQFIDKQFEGDYEWSIATVDYRVRLLLPLTSDKSKIHGVVAAIASNRSMREMTAPLQAGGAPIEPPRNSFGEDARITGTAAQRAEGELFYNEARRLEESRFAQQSVGAIAQAARAFANTEGKKIILLVTGRLPLTTSNLINAGSRYKSAVAEGNRNIAMLRDILIREANASNTSLYILAADGLQVPGQNVGSDARGSSMADTSAMFWVANETGGRLMPGNRIEQSLMELDRTSANFYSLGYTPTRESDRKYHRLEVRVKGHPSYRLQYRDGYIEIPDEMQLERTLRSYLGATMHPSALPVVVSADAPKYNADQKSAVVPFEASVPMSSLQYLQQAEGAKARVYLYVSVFDQNDAFVTMAKYVQDVDLARDEKPQGRMVVNFPGVALRKGSYRIVVAVRDEVAEAIGVAVENVKI